jgi:hypothetical protein
MAVGRMRIAHPHRIRDVGALSTGSVRSRFGVVITNRLVVVIVEAKVEVAQRTGQGLEHQIGIGVDGLCCRVA